MASVWAHEVSMQTETPQRSARRECPGGKLRVTFSEEELEIHGDDDDIQFKPLMTLIPSCSDLQR